MSFDNEISTLFSDDLNLDRRRRDTVIKVLKDENERLIQENRALRNNLVNMQQNVSLKTAKLIAEILKWSECNVDASVINILQETSKSLNQNVQNSNFRPVTPVLNESGQPEIPSVRVIPSTPNSIRSHTPTDIRDQVNAAMPYYTQNDESLLSVPVLRQKKFATTSKAISRLPGQNLAHSDTSTFLQNDKIPQSSITQTQKMVKTRIEQQKPVSADEEYLEENVSLGAMMEDESWGNMMKSTSDRDGYKNQRHITEMRASSPSGSEGYASQETRQSLGGSTGRDVVGDPVATSTPKQQTKNPTVTTKNKEMSILRRPVDAVLGIDPVMSENRQKKLERIMKNRRLIGEIAFQMDRRILQYVFSSEVSKDLRKKRRYYGFSMNNIGNMIRKESTNAEGEFDPRKELEMRHRFDYIVRALSKFGYVLEKHGPFSQDIVNKYGLLSGPPDQKLVREVGLDDPVILRKLVSEIVDNDEEMCEVLVLLDCLLLLAHDDKRPLFMW